MVKKALVGFSLLILVAGLVIYGLAVLGSPYYAYVLGDRNLFYQLEAIPAAVDECFDFHADQAAYEMCIDTAVPRIARELSQ